MFDRPGGRTAADLVRATPVLLARTVVAALLAAIGAVGCAHHSQATGKWKVTRGREFTGFAWLAFRPAESGDRVGVVWDTGLTCSAEEGVVNGDRMRVTIGGTPMRITFKGRSTAELVFDGHDAVVLLHKTKESAYFICE